jgi:hypothetical protein
VQGLISAEIANKLSKEIHATFFQHVTKAFNAYAMPILIEAFRANQTAQIPVVLNQVETAVKGLRLHVGADSVESLQSCSHVTIDSPRPRKRAHVCPFAHNCF